MRAALIALVLVLAAAVLATTSGADTPARARAQASVVAGSLGEFGTLTARGADGGGDDPGPGAAPGGKVGKAETVPRAPRPRGAPARAASLPRDIDLLDGLVTAKVARRTA